MVKAQNVDYQLMKLGKAIRSLDDGFSIYQGSLLERDGILQRFEYSIELVRKTIKLMLEFYGIEHTSIPKEIVRTGFSAGIIKDTTIIIDMIDCRNKLSHEYNEEKVDEIFSYITSNHTQLQHRATEMTHYFTSNKL